MSSSGNPRDNDLLEGIYTLPVIYSLQDPDVADELRSLLRSDITIEQRDRARELTRIGGGVELAINMAETWATKADAALSDLPDTTGTAALRAAGHHLMERLNAVR